VDKVVKAFKAVAQYPSPTSVRIMSAVTGSSGVTILSSWSQTNLERGKSIKFQQTHFVDSLLQQSSDMAPLDTSSEYVEFHSVIIGWFTVCMSVHAVINAVIPTALRVNANKDLCLCWQY
jgi:hypothetical protein